MNELGLARRILILRTFLYTDTKSFGCSQFQPLCKRLHRYYIDVGGYEQKKQEKKKKQITAD
jgi:hypothetical protein